jgi:hypothetical protein
MIPEGLYKCRVPKDRSPLELAGSGRGWLIWLG